MDRTLLNMLAYEPGTGQGAHVRITGQLDPKAYKELDRLLRAAGGKWNSHSAVHVFAGVSDARAAVDHAMAVGWDQDANPSDFYPTPATLAATLVDMAVDLDEWLRRFRYDPSTRLRVLEPGAGHGALLDALFAVLPRDRIDVTAFEVDPRNRAVLEGRNITLAGTDFLTAPVTGQVDLVLVNPPFTAPGLRNAWTIHLERALAWLAPGGTLAAIVPGTKGQEPKGPIECQLHAMANADGCVEGLGPQTFKPNDRRTDGTHINVRAMIIHTPDDHDKKRTEPYNGRQNFPAWATEMIIVNNSYALLKVLEGLKQQTRAGTLAALQSKLITQRPAWITHCAPWIEGLVDIKMLARSLLENLYAEDDWLPDAWAIAASDTAMRPACGARPVPPAAEIGTIRSAVPAAQCEWAF